MSRIIADICARASLAVMGIGIAPAVHAVPESLQVSNARVAASDSVEAVADYVLAHVKGKGEPDYAECIIFFGEGSRVCNVYKRPAADTAGKAP